ncbi:MAG: hypothetical protein HYZ29_06055 [Myxococcales bacterium]|nr:hypothetical protein [Myxococcales bacterium]
MNQLASVALVAVVLAACSASDRSVTKATGGGGGAADAQAGGAGAAGAFGGSSSGGAGTAGAGGSAGLDAGSDAPPPTGCEQCKCANQMNEWCGPYQPPSNMYCSADQPICCFCPATCYERPNCKASKSNPIGGYTWWCCEL